METYSNYYMHRHSVNKSVWLLLVVPAAAMHRCRLLFHSSVCLKRIGDTEEIRFNQNHIKHLTKKRNNTHTNNRNDDNYYVFDRQHYLLFV